MDIHEQMDSLLREHDAIYRQHERELQKYVHELQEVSGSLEGRKQELKDEERKLLTSVEVLRKEYNEIDLRQEELKKHQEKILQELANIRYPNEKKKAETEENVPESGTEKPGENVLNFGTEKSEENVLESGTEKVSEERVENESGQEEIASSTENTEDTDEENGLTKYVIEAEKVFQEGRRLECTSQMYCMELGDKELRFFAGTPFVAEILAKREKSIQLLNGIRQLNKMQEEWEFSYQNNSLKCTMPFTEAVPPETILAKCVQAVSQYFK